MSETSFEKLEVYKTTERLSDSLWEMIISWKPFERDTIGKQLVRAVDSIGANIAEGSGKYSDIDNRRFIRIARGSLYETIHWLRRSYKRNLISEEQKRNIANDIQNLTRLLAGYLRSLNKKIDTNK